MDLQTLGSSNAAFGVDLYQKLSSENPGENLFFSPISLLFALAITLLGAKEKTEAQIKSVLNLEHIPNGQLHQGFADLMNHFQTPNGKWELNIANKLYGEQTAKFLSEFVEDSKKFYGAGLEPVDFVGSSDKVTSLINEWVERQTKNKIKHLIPRNVLNALTRLVVVNAIYYKGAWKNQFRKGNTKVGSFMTASKTLSDVPFMYLNRLSTGYFYSDDLNSQVLELPYEGNSQSFVVILPDLQKTSLEVVEQRLSKEVFTTIEESLFRETVNVWLPKFKIEKESNVKESLKRMGITDLFSMKAADLSGMNGEKDLYVSHLLHKAFISVDEEGSEAAAATAVVITLKSAPIFRQPVDFKADHPFVFYIKDNKSGSILFLGKVSKL
ncbi:hypothetical protein HELRODRAFT_174066 [Helobdella robusta]|uniref:Serpin domain-containing protein n=1 Tax=Helobdella robusta TaxID=6412 RepID=T1F7J8_HELRO|nr:hypothetical protein HELRODRAFT_174066 [Helobdella robusta]ESO03166.1 hypothetical protein HELRODRAFT_174066 [Helobdella robusta]